MRPGRLAEGEQQVGLAALVFRMPVGGAQYEAAFAHTVVPPAAENVRQILGRDIFPALIEQDSLVRRLRLGNAAPGFGQFGEFDRPCQPLLIARDKFSLVFAKKITPRPKTAAEALANVALINELKQVVGDVVSITDLDDSPELAQRKSATQK